MAPSSVRPELERLQNAINLGTTVAMKTLRLTRVRLCALS